MMTDRLSRRWSQLKLLAQLFLLGVFTSVVTGVAQADDEIGCFANSEIGMPDWCDFLPLGDRPPHYQTEELYAVGFSASLVHPKKAIIIFARTREEGWVMVARVFRKTMYDNDFDRVGTDIRHIWVADLRQGPSRTIRWLSDERLEAMLATHVYDGDSPPQLTMTDDGRALGRVCLDGSSIRFLVYRDGKFFSNARHSCAGRTMIDEFAERLGKDAVREDGALKFFVDQLWLD